MDKARGLLAEVREVVAGHDQVYHAGFVLDAQKEYCEASLTLAMVQGTPLPGPEDLLVEDASWLNGLGEAVGELRRYILDLLRHGDCSEAEPLLGPMDEVYYVLTSMDYPDALTRWPSSHHRRGPGMYREDARGPHPSPLLARHGAETGVLRRHVALAVSRTPPCTPSL